jgi:CBS domain-containing protein
MDNKRKVRKALVTAAPDTSAQTLAILMRDRHVGAVVITEKDRPVGIVTDRDLVSRVVARYQDPLTIRARDIMTPDLVIAREGTQLAKLTEQMRARGIRRVPIVNGKGRLVNILTLDDMLVVLGEEIANLGRAVVTGMGREARAAARGRVSRLRSERLAAARPR